MPLNCLIGVTFEVVFFKYNNHFDFGEMGFMGTSKNSKKPLLSLGKIVSSYHLWHPRKYQRYQQIERPIAHDLKHPPITDALSPGLAYPIGLPGDPAWSLEPGEGNVSTIQEANHQGRQKLRPMHKNQEYSRSQHLPSQGFGSAR